MTSGHDAPGAMRTILVVYAAFRPRLRTSAEDHLRCFGRYSGRRTVYVNAAVPGAAAALRRVKPDLIVYHSLLLDARFNQRRMAVIERRLDPLKASTAVKVMLPQDEHCDSDYLRAFASAHGVGHIMSLAHPDLWPTLYGDLTVRLSRVLPGYLDPATVARIDQLAASVPRTLDLAYRAWAASPALGSRGRLKAEIGGRMAALVPRSDVQTQAWGRQLVGDDWFRLLLSARWVPGVEGGASINDRDGSLFRAVAAWRASHPDGSYEEAEAACFPGRDGELDYRVISPRHLEAAASRTAQVLVEGDYNGLLQPWVHYLPLRPDLANAAEVAARMADEAVRTEMADRARRDLVDSGLTASSAMRAATSAALARSGRSGR